MEEFYCEVKFVHGTSHTLVTPLSPQGQLEDRIFTCRRLQGMTGIC